MKACGGSRCLRPGRLSSIIACLCGLRTAVKRQHRTLRDQLTEQSEHIQQLQQQLQHQQSHWQQRCPARSDLSGWPSRPWSSARLQQQDEHYHTRTDCPAKEIRLLRTPRVSGCFCLENVNLYWGEWQDGSAARIAKPSEVADI